MAHTRCFHFLEGPRPEDRLGRFVAGDDLVIGAPVASPNAVNVDANGQLTVDYATQASAPRKGLSGILNWENPTADFPGLDPALTRPVDVDVAPTGVSVQVCSGDYVRVRLANIAARTFYTRPYTARNMVAGLGGATPTVEVGELLTPGPGTDIGGYWQVTTDLTKAWLRVTAINNDVGELDAQMLF